MYRPYVLRTTTSAGRKEAVSLSCFGMRFDDLSVEPNKMYASLRYRALFRGWVLS